MTPAASPDAALAVTPRWGPLEAIACFGLASLGLLIVFGVTAGLVGWFHPLAVGVAALAGGAVLASPARRSARGHRLAAADMAVLVMVAGWVAWGASNASQQVFSTTDPGVYLTSGWLLADGRGPLLETAPGLVDETDGSFGLSGYYDDRGDGKLSPQFPRGLPVVLAVAKAAGGPGGIFIAPVVIAGLALLFVYLFATHFVSRWWSALAAASLAVNLAFVHFGRGAYSEPLMMTLVLGALWLLMHAFHNRALGWVVGVALGAALCVRIDALIVITTVPLLVAYAALGGRRHRDRLLPATVRAGAALAVGGVVAVCDLVLLSPSYLEAQDRRLLMVAGLVVLVTVVALLAPRALRWITATLGRHRAVAANVVAVAVVLVAAFVLVIRPFGPTAHTTTGSRPYLAVLLEREGYPPDPTRTMAESTGLWLWWYLGPLLVAGVFGFAALVRRAVLRIDVAAVVVLSLVAVTGGIYLWRPSINPLQIWAMRRFLPVVIPGMTVLGVWAVSSAVARIRTGGLRIAAGAVAVAVALTPVVRLAPVPSTSEVPGAHALVVGVCAALPENAALFAETSSQPLIWGVALAVVCEVPVVVTSPGNLPGLMTATAAEGADVLWFGVECSVEGEVVVTAAAELPNLEQTVMRPPSHLGIDFYGVTVTRPATLEVSCAT